MPGGFFERPCGKKRLFSSVPVVPLNFHSELQKEKENEKKEPSEEVSINTQRKKEDYMTLFEQERSKRFNLDANDIGKMPVKETQIDNSIKEDENKWEIGEEDKVKSEEEIETITAADSCIRCSTMKNVNKTMKVIDEFRFNLIEENKKSEEKRCKCQERVRKYLGGIRNEIYLFKRHKRKIDALNNENVGGKDVKSPKKSEEDRRWEESGKYKSYGRRKDSGRYEKKGKFEDCGRFEKNPRHEEDDEFEDYDRYEKYSRYEGNETSERRGRYEQSTKCKENEKNENYGRFKNNPKFEGRRRSEGKRSSERRRSSESRRSEEKRRSSERRRSEENRSSERRRSEENRRNEEKRRSIENRRSEEKRRSDENRRHKDNPKFEENRRHNDSPKFKEYRKSGGYRKFEEDSKHKDNPKLSENRKHESPAKSDQNRRHEENRKVEDNARSESNGRCEDDRKYEENQRSEKKRKYEEKGRYEGSSRHEDRRSEKKRKTENGEIFEPKVIRPTENQLDTKTKNKGLGGKLIVDIQEEELEVHRVLSKNRIQIDFGINQGRGIVDGVAAKVGEEKSLGEIRKEEGKKNDKREEEIGIKTKKNVVEDVPAKDGQETSSGEIRKEKERRNDEREEISNKTKKSLSVEEKNNVGIRKEIETREAVLNSRSIHPIGLVSLGEVVQSELTIAVGKSFLFSNKFGCKKTLILGKCSQIFFLIFDHRQRYHILLWYPRTLFMQGLIWGFPLVLIGSKRVPRRVYARDLFRLIIHHYLVSSGYEIFPLQNVIL